MAGKHISPSTGHHQHPGHRLRLDGPAARFGAKGIAADLPQAGWVEHDPEEIWSATVEVCRGALAKAKLDAKALAGIGITNQRETTVVWDRATGKPVHNAIVWQDRRTADYCAELKRAGHEDAVAAKTGLVLDPYFAGTKLHWILENVAGVRAQAGKGALAAGTIESFLLWRLTGGKTHASDASNACRTLLLDIHKGAWTTRCWDCSAFRRRCCPR